MIFDAFYSLKIIMYLFILAGRKRRVKAYYKKQESLCEGFNEMETITKSGSLPGALTEVSIVLKLLFPPNMKHYAIFTLFCFQDEMTNLAKSERMAIYVSNVANLILFIAKLYASIQSRSLAVIASTLDSFLDLLSGFILWFTSNAMRNPNRYRYPIGKNRMQPVVSSRLTFNPKSKYTQTFSAN